MPNRLINETSPYLLQHAHNPVDWYPWGEEAFAKARNEDKPVLLSIGYSACHWCHVMEHESFEDEATAALMNEGFVSIKVDREERPDLDQIYMAAVQGLTGRGGWPMTVFLTPDGKPFYGGTYYPPEDRMGMPGFRRVLQSISDAYGRDRGQIDLQASRITAFVQEQTLLSAPADTLEASILDDAFGALAKQFDAQRGGFGGAPKFPQPMALDFLLHFHHRTGGRPALDMVEHTLQRMAAGGIYDQIGGGFHRYAVDDRWLVPHFEKMLYDNALLARCYLHAYQVTENDAYRRIVEDTLDYVRREMQHGEGGFFSTQDADSEGEEGKYYVWTPAEIEAAVGSADDAAIAAGFYGVRPEGNFEGKTILTVSADPDAVASRHGISRGELDEIVGRARQRMLQTRGTRVPPARDDKILSGWNGLMLRTFAEAARVLRRPEDLAAAEANARFLTTQMWRDGTLYRVHKDGQTRVPGFLEDYAGVADGLLTLYQTTFDKTWLRPARDLVDVMTRRFWDEDTGAFFDTAADAESLVARPRDIWDNATPSGTSLAAHALLTLWGLTGEAAYERITRTTLASLATGMRQHPVGLGNLLAALARYLAPPREVAIIGEPTAATTRALVDAIQPRYLPDVIVAVGMPEDADSIALVKGRGPVDGRATAYVCRNFVCELPVTEPADLLKQLSA
jgi:uncharacterized protein YyaL (SSP411 family)